MRATVTASIWMAVGRSLRESEDQIHRLHLLGCEGNINSFYAQSLLLEFWQKACPCCVAYRVTTE